MQETERDRIFDDWLAHHKGILFKVVHAYAFEHADRQDLFQEVVLQVWHSVGAYRGESSLPTWLYRVALNTAIGWGRKDRLCLPRQARRAQTAFPSATLHWFAQSGHFPMWDQPEETIRLILESTGGNGKKPAAST